MQVRLNAMVGCVVRFAVIASSPMGPLPLVLVPFPMANIPSAPSPMFGIGGGSRTGGFSTDSEHRGLGEGERVRPRRVPPGARRGSGPGVRAADPPGVGGAEFAAPRVLGRDRVVRVG